MFEVWLYTAASTCCAGISVWLVWHVLHRWLAPRRTRLLVGALMTGIILIVPVIPYARVEVYTLWYGRSLLPAAQDAVARIAPGEKIIWSRVLSVTRTEGLVYVVETATELDGPKGSVRRGELIDLVRHGRAWQFAGDYTTVWSDAGSAAGNVFPPYRAKGEW